MIETLIVRDDHERAARRLRFEAAARTPCRGLGPPTYRLWHVDRRTSVISQLIFTRDTGHHSSGWFKNPDYERCYHLSISFAAVTDWLSRKTEMIPFEQVLAGAWVMRVYPPAYHRTIWEESAKLPQAIAVGIRHYRAFCNEAWQPIVPRGEVYSTELTELGWRSWSAQHPDDPHASHLRHENPDR